MSLLDELQQEARNRLNTDITLAQIESVVDGFEEAGIDPEAPISLEKWLKMSEG